VILHGDPLDQSMFWVGAMFAFTPVIVGGTFIAVWWRGRQRERAQGPSQGQGEPAANVSQRTDVAPPS